jgi:superfamily II DNA or RNA helicase
MEELVKIYSNKISSYKNKKSKIVTLNKLIKEQFNIYERTIHSMDSLSNLLEKYNLKIFNSHGVELSLKNLQIDFYEQVYAVYIESKKDTSDIIKIDNLKKSIPFQSSGIISIANSNSSLTLLDHQTESVKLMEKYFSENQQPIKGLLVLPTGGGKTVTAVYWILKNFINKKKKVIWIAHRHELLEQAKKTFFKLSYKNILDSVDSYKFRIISGLNDHDKPKDINRNDDLIIASKDSLRLGINFLIEEFLKFNEEILLIIDEAHHATARSYT